MSPRGWPKGKPRGPRTNASEARKAADKKFTASAVRSNIRRKTRAAELTTGRSFGAGLNETFDPRRVTVEASPAAWVPVSTDIGDCLYVTDPLDDALIRAVHDRVVYASRPWTHSCPPFQDVTIDVIAAVERSCMKREKNDVDLRKRSLPRPSVKHFSKSVITERQITVIRLIAAGLSETQIGYQLGISPRTVKMHCDVLREKLEVATRREIPLAYRMRTGKDPFAHLEKRETVVPLERIGPPLTAVVDEMFTTSVVGKSLLDVVSEMFDS